MIDVLQKAALEGGEVLKKYFKAEELAISHKTNHQNLVTKADVEAQEIIHKIILDEMQKLGISENDIGFIGEEKLHKVGKHTFIIDPLDGTSNFATGYDEFGVLIGYMYEGELQAGVIYMPIQDEWYFGEKGKGAYMIKDKKRIDLERREINLKETFLLSSISYSDDQVFEIDKKILALKNLFRGVRMIGSAAADFVLILHNIGGMMMIAGTSIWDLAAGRVILEEIGFKMYDRNGNDLQFNLQEPNKKYPFFTCQPSQKEKVWEILSKFS